MFDRIQSGMYDKTQCDMFDRIQSMVCMSKRTVWYV